MGIKDFMKFKALTFKRVFNFLFIFFCSCFVLAELFF